jgi:hypothetical protein
MIPAQATAAKRAGKKKTRIATYIRSFWGLFCFVFWSFFFSKEQSPWHVVFLSSPHRKTPQSGSKPKKHIKRKEIRGGAEVPEVARLQ